MDYIKRLSLTGSICGVTGSIIFLVVAGLIEQLYWQPKFQVMVKTTGDFLSLLGDTPYSQISMGTHLLCAFALLLLAVGFIGLYKLLSIDKKKVSVTIGSVLGILACSIMVEMAIIQGSVVNKMSTLYLNSSAEDQGGVVNLYRGLKSLEFGMDIGFDFFFFSAWILLAFAMLKHKSIGKIIGFIGLILFILTAALNIWAAPNPPSLELSPLCCLWILAVYIQALRISLKIPTASNHHVI